MPEPRTVPNRPLLDELAVAFIDDPAVSVGTMFRSPGLRVGSKIFAFLGFEGELMVKLPVDRVAELVQAGRAVQVTMGRRTMREWVTLADQGDNDRTLAFWRPLAVEAHRFVGG